MYLVGVLLPSCTHIESYEKIKFFLFLLLPVAVQFLDDRKTFCSAKLNYVCE